MLQISKCCNNYSDALKGDLMADKVKLSKDGSSIDFIQSESIPTSVKKFRQSPEIEGFYRFIYENDLQKEAFEILDRIVNERKLKKSKDTKDAKIALATSAPVPQQSNSKLVKEKDDKHVKQTQKAKK